MNVVLTGGPCSGKSTALSSIKECLEDRGYKVFVVNEAATDLINKGIKPFGENKVSMYEFQRKIINYQLKKENLIRMKAKFYKKSVVIYDRALLDGKAYINDISWYKLLSEEKLNEQNLLNRYDLVLHLVSVAYDKEDLFTNSNNEARYETKEEAKEKDAATLNAYLGHHNLKVIDNKTDFKTKIERVKNAILQELNEPLVTFNQLKFPIDIEKSDIDKIKLISNKSYIIQNYLLSKDDQEIKLRKRITGKDITYYLIKEFKNKDGDIFKTTNIISERAYNSYLKNVDPRLKQLEKIRYSFKNDKDVYNLDVFLDSNIAILENNTTNKDEILNIPNYLHIVKNYSGSLKNIDIARKKVLSKK